MSDSPQNLRGDVAGNRKPPATIYDVAQHLGVSPSTVSRALNKPGRINAKTEKRIRDAAAEMNYRFNPMARGLQTGRTDTLGLIVSDITNPVYFTLVRGAEQVAAAGGFTLVLADSQENAEREAETANRLLPSVDGLLLVGSRLDDGQIKQLAAQKPLVVVNREVDSVPAVVPDVTPGIHAALQHLYELGHRSIVFLAGPAESWMSRLRWETLLDGALERDMSVVEIGPGVPTVDGGRDKLKLVRASGATAVFAFNDLMAIGLLDACRTAGLEVPRDLSIVGFDAIFGSDFTTPPITTIRSPLDRVGAEAVGQLIALAADRSDELIEYLSTEFVLRGSTGPAASR